METFFYVTGPLWWESTSGRCIPLTKASDAELWCFLWSAPVQTVEQTIETPVIWDATMLIMTSLYWVCCGTLPFYSNNFNGWVQDCSNSIALAIDLSIISKSGTIEYMIKLFEAWSRVGSWWGSYIPWSPILWIPDIVRSIAPWYWVERQVGQTFEVLKCIP